MSACPQQPAEGRDGTPRGWHCRDRELAPPAPQTSPAAALIPRKILSVIPQNRPAFPLAFPRRGRTDPGGARGGVRDSSGSWQGAETPQNPTRLPAHPRALTVPALGRDGEQPLPPGCGADPPTDPLGSFSAVDRPQQGWDVPTPQSGSPPGDRVKAPAGGAGGTWEVLAPLILAREESRTGKGLVINPSGQGLRGRPPGGSAAWGTLGGSSEIATVPPARPPRSPPAPLCQPVRVYLAKEVEMC